MCQGLNSHYFHIIGDGKLNPIVGIYILIIRIPMKGGKTTIPNKTRLLTMAHIYSLIRYTYPKGGTGDSIFRWWEGSPGVRSEDKVKNHHQQNMGALNGTFVLEGIKLDTNLW